MDTDEDDLFLTIKPAPTATRPLLGLTVLVIEDSRFACEALRLLCLRSGARIRRADSLRAARRHLRVYRPSVVLVDIGLPDGNGADLIAELCAIVPRPELILGMSGDPDAEAAAIDAGAAGFAHKPILSISTFQNLILSQLPSDRHPMVPRPVSDDFVEPDMIAFRDDIAHVSDVIETREDDRSLGYVAQFLGGVARSAQDDALETAAHDLACRVKAGEETSKSLAHIMALVNARLDQKIAI